MIINNYLYRSTAKPMFIGIAGCTAFFLIDALSELIERIVVSGTPVIFVMEYLTYHMLDLLTFTMPMGMLIGSVTAYGAMSDSNETIALNSLGVSLFSILKPAFILGFNICLSIIFLNQYITPASARRQQNLFKKFAFKYPSFNLDAKRFITDIDGFSLYLNSYNKKESRSGNFILFDNSEGLKFPSVALGESVSLDDGFIIFHNAVSNRMDENGRTNTFINFSEQKVPIRDKIDTVGFFDLSNSDSHLSLWQVFRTIQYRRSKGYTTLNYERTIHLKLSLAVGAIILSVMGALLAVGAHKRFRRGDGKLSGIAVLFLYWVWLIVSRPIMSLGYSGFVMWLPNLGLVILSLLIYMRKRRI